MLVRHPFWVRLCFTALIAPLGSLAFLCFLARVSFHPCCRRFENRLCSLDSSFPARLLQVLASSYLLACLSVCLFAVWLVCVFGCLQTLLCVCVCFSHSHSLCVSLCFLSSFSYDVTHELGVDITILIFCSDDICSFINNLLNNVSISA